MQKPNKKKALGLIRTILTAGGGYISGRGYIDESLAIELAGAITIIIGGIWSWFSPEKNQGF